VSQLEMLRAAVDVLRRLDPIYCASHEVAQVTDDEIDSVLEILEEAIDPEA
jgi:hypothetical protein